MFPYKKSENLNKLFLEFDTYRINHEKHENLIKQIDAIVLNAYRDPKFKKLCQNPKLEKKWATIVPYIYRNKRNFKFKIPSNNSFNFIASFRLYVQARNHKNSSIGLCIVAEKFGGYITCNLIIKGLLSLLDKTNESSQLEEIFKFMDIAKKNGEPGYMLCGLSYVAIANYYERIGSSWKKSICYALASGNFLLAHKNKTPEEMHNAFRGHSFDPEIFGGLVGTNLKPDQLKLELQLRSLPFNNLGFSSWTGAHCSRTLVKKRLLSAFIKKNESKPFGNKISKDNFSVLEKELRTSLTGLYHKTTYFNKKHNNSLNKQPPVDYPEILGNNGINRI